VWDSLERDWGIDFCCVWESLWRVSRSEFVLCVGQFGVGLGELDCAVYGTVWGGFGGVSLCCV